VVRIGARGSHITFSVRLEVDHIIGMPPQKPVNTDEIAIKYDNTGIEPPFGILVPTSGKVYSRLGARSAEESKLSFLWMTPVVCKAERSQLFQVSPLTPSPNELAVAVLMGKTRICKYSLCDAKNGDCTGTESGNESFVSRRSLA
jgi:hypothetical protein